MKDFNKIIAIHQEIRVNLRKLHSYDVVANPGFGSAKMEWINDYVDDVPKEYNRVYSEIDPYGEEDWDN